MSQIETDTYSATVDDVQPIEAAIFRKASQTGDPPSCMAVCLRLTDLDELLQFLMRLYTVMATKAQSDE